MGNTLITTKDPSQAFLEIVYLFILPVVLIYIGAVPYSWRLLVLLGVSLLIMSIIRHQRWPREKLGLVRQFSSRSIRAWGAFTLVGVFAIIYYAGRFDFEPINLFDWKESWSLILFFIPLSVLQEVAYRGFLSARLREFSFSTRHRILLNAGLFALLHIIYPYAAITLPIAFLGGVIFAWLYERHRSLSLACISHCALNFVAVLFGFFS